MGHGSKSLRAQQGCGRFQQQRNAQIVEICMLHLEFAMELAAEQIRRGDYFIFEQPHSARSWQTGVAPCFIAGTYVLNC